MVISELPARFTDDPRIDATLGRLYADTLRVDPPARDAATAHGLDEASPGFYAAMKAAYMPVTPDLGMVLYLLLRATRARVAVEFGTSLGIAAIWMAAALRDNGGGRLVTTEYDPDKAVRAHANLADAGLGAQVEIVVGAAERTLQDHAPEAIDFVLLDGAKSAYLPVLRVLEPRLAPAALIMADNAGMAGARALLDYADAPGSGYARAALSTAALGATHPCTLLMRAR